MSAGFRRAEVGGHAHIENRRVFHCEHACVVIHRVEDAPLLKIREHANQWPLVDQARGAGVPGTTVSWVIKRHPADRQSLVRIDVAGHRQPDLPQV